MPQAVGASGQAGFCAPFRKSKPELHRVSDIVQFCSL